MCNAGSVRAKLWGKLRENEKKAREGNGESENG